jgi:hypothetical protein
VLAGVLLLMIIPVEDPRWTVLGVAWGAWLVPVLFHSWLEKREISFAVSVSAWRFAGALTLWLVRVLPGGGG